MGTVVRAFGDPDLTPDNFSQFSQQEISADSKAKGLAQLEPIPPARSTTPMDLTAVIGAAATQKIQTAGEIVFHTVGDTGGVHSPQFQFAVADAMAADSNSGAAFWYHLGDVVYYFGEATYYYDQFFEPYRGCGLSARLVRQAKTFYSRSTRSNACHPRSSTDRHTDARKRRGQRLFQPAAA